MTDSEYLSAESGMQVYFRSFYISSFFLKPNSLQKKIGMFVSSFKSQNNVILIYGTI
jgi:hypothetical protein